MEEFGINCPICEMTTPIDEETVHNIIILVEGEGDGLENQGDLDEGQIQDNQYDKYEEDQPDLEEEDDEEVEEEDPYRENENDKLDEEIDDEEEEIDM